MIDGIDYYKIFITISFPFISLYLKKITLRTKRRSLKLSILVIVDEKARVTVQVMAADTGYGLYVQLCKLRFPLALRTKPHTSDALRTSLHVHFIAEHVGPRSTYPIIESNHVLLKLPVPNTVPLLFETYKFLKIIISIVSSNRGS